MKPITLLIAGGLACLPCLLASAQAQEAEPDRPKVLIIGKNGLSTNQEPAEASSATNTEPATASSKGPAGIEHVVLEEPAPEPVAPTINWEPMVQAMQLMIEQQKMTLQSMEQSIEKSRTDAAETVRVSNAAMQEKLTAMEAALTTQRTQDAEAIARMNRLVIGVASGFAGIGFLVMVFTAWFFMRTMNKVSEINANLQSQLLALPQIQQPLVGDGGGGTAGGNRLVGALEQLEKRIRDLEHTSTSPGTEPVDIIPPTTHAAETGGRPTESSFRHDSVDEDEDEPSLATLMAKGQTLLNLDEAEDALACFNRVIERDRNNPEALLKKGTALERLRRMQEALEAYDEAIRQDDTMTMAYLAKGGVCNRLERYSEALECYEKALRTQQQPA